MSGRAAEAGPTAARRRRHDLRPGPQPAVAEGVDEAGVLPLTDQLPLSGGGILLSARQPAPAVHPFERDRDPAGSGHTSSRHPGPRAAGGHRDPGLASDPQHVRHLGGSGGRHQVRGRLPGGGQRPEAGGRPALIPGHVDRDSFCDGLRGQRSLHIVTLGRVPAWPGPGRIVLKWPLAGGGLWQDCGDGRGGTPVRVG